METYTGETHAVRLYMRIDREPSSVFTWSEAVRIRNARIRCQGVFLYGKPVLSEDIPGLLQRFSGQGFYAFERIVYV